MYEKCVFNSLPPNIYYLAERARCVRTVDVGGFVADRHARELVAVGECEGVRTHVVLDSHANLRDRLGTVKQGWHGGSNEVKKRRKSAKPQKKVQNLLTTA